MKLSSLRKPFVVLFLRKEPTLGKEPGLRAMLRLSKKPSAEKKLDWPPISPNSLKGPKMATPLEKYTYFKDLKDAPITSFGVSLTINGTPLPDYANTELGAGIRLAIPALVAEILRTLKNDSLNELDSKIATAQAAIDALKAQKAAIRNNG